MSVSKEEFDRIRAIGSRLKMIFSRDGASIPAGYEDYIVRSVEEASRLTQRAPDACPVCLGSGVRTTKLTGAQTKCRTCHGTGQRRLRKPFGGNSSADRKVKIMSLKSWSDLHGEENDGSFTLRRLSPSEKWCDRCHCYVERRDAVRWTADGSFTHYLCPGCDTELWEPESNEELYTAEEIAEAKSRRTQRAADVCHESSDGIHQWYQGSAWEICAHCGTRRLRKRKPK